MKAGKPIIYWDTCVFLAWIKDEDRPNNEMMGVNDVAMKISKDHVILLTSEITMSEILEATLTDEAKAKLADIFKRRNCQRASIDNKIVQLCSEIRNYYQQRKAIDGLPTIEVPDAIHLATAIHYGAAEFHTFDERDDHGKKRALLPLNGNVASYPLIICKPPLPEQMPLFTVSTGLQETEENSDREPT